MTTPCVPNPYDVVAAYAIGKPSPWVSREEAEAADAAIRKSCVGDPPFLDRFLAQYPAQEHRNPQQAIEVEELLQCIWRGEFKEAFNVKSGPYIHFKGTTYLCFGIGTLIQGPKEEVAVVYSNKEGEVWIRPLDEWVEVVKWPDGKYRPRFMKEGSV